MATIKSHLIIISCVCMMETFSIRRYFISDLHSSQNMASEVHKHYSGQQDGPGGRGDQ